MVMGASMYWVRKAVSFVAVGRDALLAGSGGQGTLDFKVSRE